MLDEVRSTAQCGMAGAGTRKLSSTDDLDQLCSHVNGEMQCRVDAKQDAPRLIDQARTKRDRHALAACYLDGTRSRADAALRRLKQSFADATCPSSPPRMPDNTMRDYVKTLGFFVRPQQLQRPPVYAF